MCGCLRRVLFFALDLACMWLAVEYGSTVGRSSGGSRSTPSRTPTRTTSRTTSRTGRSRTSTSTSRASGTSTSRLGTSGTGTSTSRTRRTATGTTSRRTSRTQSGTRSTRSDRRYHGLTWQTAGSAGYLYGYRRYLSRSRYRMYPDQGEFCTRYGARDLDILQLDGESAVSFLSA